MSTESIDIKKHARKYQLVFGALLILTIVTVLVAEIHVTIALGIIIALLIATVKASLVASFFMHLSHEKPWIYWILLITLFCLISCMGLIIGGEHSTYEGLYYVP